jgi:hypothetical protein
MHHSRMRSTKEEEAWRSKTIVAPAPVPSTIRSRTDAEGSESLASIQQIEEGEEIGTEGMENEE